MKQGKNTQNENKGDSKKTKCKEKQKLRITKATDHDVSICLFYLK